MPEQQEKDFKAFYDALLQLVVDNPPAGFKSTYFTICCMSGRIEEATKIMQDFLAKEK